MQQLLPHFVTGRWHGRNDLGSVDCGGQGETLQACEDRTGNNSLVGEVGMEGFLTMAWQLAIVYVVVFLAYVAVRLWVTRGAPDLGDNDKPEWMT